MSAVVTCGMPDEARVLTAALRPGTLIFSGTDKLNLPKLIPASTTRLLCMGVCGGLLPPFEVGNTVLADTVVDYAGTLAFADPAWNAKAVAAAARHRIAATVVPYYSSGIMDEANTAGQRARLSARYSSKPAAIDDETRYVVAQAKAMNVPFNVIRPLSDDYSETLPLSATGAIMNKDGSADIGYLLWSLGQNQGPGAVNLFTVAMDYKKSLDALEAIAAALSDLIAKG